MADSIHLNEAIRIVLVSKISNFLGYQWSSLYISLVSKTGNEQSYARTPPLLSFYIRMRFLQRGFSASTARRVGEMSTMFPQTGGQTRRQTTQMQSCRTRVVWILGGQGNTNADTVRFAVKGVLVPGCAGSLLQLRRLHPDESEVE